MFHLIQMAAYETYETDFVYDSMDNPSVEKVCRSSCIWTSCLSFRLIFNSTLKVAEAAPSPVIRENESADNNNSSNKKVRHKILNEENYY